MNLRVLTYNVFGMPWGLSSIDAVLLWAFYKTDAEILCLQEVFSKDHKDRIQEICSQPNSHWNCWFPDAEPTCLSKWTSYFESASGLCILTRKDITLTSEPYFEPFETVASVDRFVRKGFFHLMCEKEKQEFHILTVHFQSDFTECKCRVRYEDVRIQQELQVYRYMKNLPNAIVVGDFNMNRFYHLRFVNYQRESTFRETGESLDHCLTLYPSSVKSEKATYFHDIDLSDHTPVLFQLRFLKS
jgi:exonuclease III